MFSRFRCMTVAVIFTTTSFSPNYFLDLSKQHVSLGDKIADLRQLLNTFPLDEKCDVAREQLIALLVGSNRYEEALQEYRQQKSFQKRNPEEIDYTLIEYLLKTGRYGEVLRETSLAQGPVRDFIRDMKLMEFRVQALLAQGRYAIARESVENWLAVYQSDGMEGSRFEGDVRAIRYLARHLRILEQDHGAQAKPIFTASVPDSLKQWAHQQEVPIYFFKLIPAHPAGQLYEPVLPGRHEVSEYFEAYTEDLNRGFRYLSKSEFSLKFKEMKTLYVADGDLDPDSMGGHLLTSRVYIHTIPSLYRLAGQAFVVLIDYRVRSEEETAYMGDGLIHLSANKLSPMVVMHEILHGLGATHQEWGALQRLGHRFDPDDRGLMTFGQNGELHDLGIEEKNRAVLGWPRVSVIRLPSDTDNARLPDAMSFPQS